MSPYLAVFRARLLQLLQYRAAAWAGALTQAAFGLIHVGVFTAFYASSTGARPMSLPEVVAYVWLGQAFFALLPWRLDAELQGMFLRGEVAYELLRPVDLYAFWYCRHLANLLAPASLRFLPVLLLATGRGELPAPPTLAAGVAFALALAGGVLAGAAMLTTVTLTSFWTISAQGVANLHVAAFFLLSGMSVPLPLFPDWAQGFLALQPYRAFTDAPFRLYLGHLPPAALPGVLAHQLVWAMTFALVGYAVLGAAHRRLVIQGG